MKGGDGVDLAAPARQAYAGDMEAFERLLLAHLPEIVAETTHACGRS